MARIEEDLRYPGTYRVVPETRLQQLAYDKALETIASQTPPDQRFHNPFVGFTNPNEPEALRTKRALENTAQFLNYRSN